MDANKLSIKPDSVLHRMLKLIALEVAKEFSTVSAATASAKNSDPNNNNLLPGNSVGFTA